MSARPRCFPLALVALAAALLLALPASASARLPSGFVGLSSQDIFGGSNQYRGEQLDIQRAAGIRMLHQNFEWDGIERAPGRYDFAFYDASVAAAAHRGIRILPILYSPPRFRSSAPASGAQRGVYPPRRAGHMAAFAVQLVRRYGPRGSFWRENPRVPKLPIRAWKVWNEPNLPVYWRPRSSPRAYTHLLVRVSRAIRREDRRAEIVTAGLPPTTQRGAISLQRFIRGIYRAGGRRGFTTLAVNAYARDTRELAGVIRGVRRTMNRHGHRRGRIWITEIGWGTGGPRHRFNVGFARQSNRISSALRWIRRNRRALRIRGFAYFQWRDQRPYPPLYKDLWGLHTGLLNIDGVRKPAYFAFQSSVSRFR